MRPVADDILSFDRNANQVSKPDLQGCEGCVLQKMPRLSREHEKKGGFDVFFAPDARHSMSEDVKGITFIYSGIPFVFKENDG